MRRGNKIQLGLGVSYALFYLGYTSFFPFQTIYLTSIGYGTDMVALLSTCTSIANFLAQLLIGRLPGTAASTRRTILLLLALAVLLGFCVGWFHGNTALVIVSILSVTLVDFSLIGRFDSYTLCQPGVHYSTMRTLGSLSGAVATMVLGGVYTRWGITNMFSIHGLCMALCFCCFLTLPVEGASAGAVQHGSGFVRTFWPLFLGGGLLFLPWRVILVYLPIILINRGGNAAYQGAAMSIMSFSIMPVMLAYPLLRKRFSCRFLLAVGGLAMAVRLGIMAVASAPWVLTAAQLLEAVSYGLPQPAIMEVLGKAAPELRPKVVSIWTGIQMALCTVAGNGLVSLLNGYFELNTIFGWMILPAVAGMFILLCAPCTKEKWAYAG